MASIDNTGRAWVRDKGFMSAASQMEVDKSKTKKVVFMAFHTHCCKIPFTGTLSARAKNTVICSGRYSLP